MDSQLNITYNFNANDPMLYDPSASVSSNSSFGTSTGGDGNSIRNGGVGGSHHLRYDPHLVELGNSSNYSDDNMVMSPPQSSPSRHRQQMINLHQNQQLSRQLRQHHRVLSAGGGGDTEYGEGGEVFMDMEPQFGLQQHNQQHSNNMVTGAADYDPLATSLNGYLPTLSEEQINQILNFGSTGAQAQQPQIGTGASMPGYHVNMLDNKHVFNNNNVSPPHQMMMSQSHQSPGPFFNFAQPMPNQHHINSPGGMMMQQQYMMPPQQQQQSSQPQMMSQQRHVIQVKSNSILSGGTVIMRDNQNSHVQNMANQRPVPQAASCSGGSVKIMNGDNNQNLQSSITASHIQATPPEDNSNAGGDIAGGRVVITATTVGAAGGGAMAEAPLLVPQQTMHVSHNVIYKFVNGKHVKIWQCGICNKEFNQQYILMRHLPTHTDERKYVCNVCNKAFRQMSTLSQHRAIHSVERPFECERCDKTFNRISTLISHRKTHTNYKPHECHICHKAFHQKGNLRNHIFTHTNERPYKCDLCDKGFNQMSNLMCHKAKTHKRTDKPTFSCRTCNKEFEKRMSLRNHEQYEHGGVSTPPKADEIKYTNGVIVDNIRTAAMKLATEAGQKPFALLLPLNGIPVLVRVLGNGDKQQVLVPATADDLRTHGHFVVNFSDRDANDINNDPQSRTDSSNTNNRLQIRIPVVATVIQRRDADGSVRMEVVSPGPDHNGHNELLHSVVSAAAARSATAAASASPDSSANDVTQSSTAPQQASTSATTQQRQQIISMTMANSGIDSCNEREGVTNLEKEMVPLEPKEEVVDMLPSPSTPQEESSSNHEPLIFDGLFDVERNSNDEDTERFVNSLTNSVIF